MDTLLILRKRPTQPGVEALYQHQAILSVARSWLTRRSEEGMEASGSRMIVPCDLDILPLLALVANDYSEVVYLSEGSGRETTPGPIIVYQDGEAVGQNERLITKFLQPRWFDARPRFLGLLSLIERLRPSTCVLIGDATSRLQTAVTSTRYRFERVIGFAAFERQEQFGAFSGTDYRQQVIMADRVYSARLERDQREERSFIDYRSFWDIANSGESQTQPFERFVPWGPAFETNMI